VDHQTREWKVRAKIVAGVLSMLSWQPAKSEMTCFDLSVRLCVDDALPVYVRRVTSRVITPGCSVAQLQQQSWLTRMAVTAVAVPLGI
jgi:hypothetical protein